MTTAKKDEKVTGLALLREPFAAHQISKLPRLNYCCSNATGKVCPRHEKKKCQHCGAFISTAHVDLDFVGHAALTDRLLDVDPNWTWEPVPDPQSLGLPVLPDQRCMWIRLTICGVTRYGFGDAQGKAGGDAIKEIIGDALRNAAMRFGAALDLWHKGDLHVDDDTAALAEHQRLTHQTLADDKKADRGTPADDPWAKPVETDQKWLADWLDRLKRCDSIGGLRGLYDEAVTQKKELHLSEEDFNTCAALKDSKKTELEAVPA